MASLRFEQAFKAAMAQQGDEEGACAILPAANAAQGVVRDRSDNFEDLFKNSLNLAMQPEPLCVGGAQGGEAYTSQVTACMDTKSRFPVVEETRGGVTNTTEKTQGGQISTQFELTPPQTPPSRESTDSFFVRLMAEAGARARAEERERATSDSNIQDTDFYSDVDYFLSNWTDITSRDTFAPSNKSDSLFDWAVLSSSVKTRLENDSIPAIAELDYDGAPKGPDSLVVRKKKEISKTIGPRGQTIRTEYTKTSATRTGDLLERAQQVAGNIAASNNVFHRTSGFLAAAPTNEVFAVAVSKRLAGHFTVTAPVYKKIAHEQGRVLADGLAALVNRWAARKTVLVNTTAEFENKAEAREMAETMTGESVPDMTVVYQAIAIASSKTLFSACLDSHVCVICAAQKMVSGEVEDITFPNVNTKSDPISYQSMVKELRDGRNVKVLHSMAKIHNKMMHALNGNINMVVAEKEDRKVVIARALTESWNSVVNKLVPAQQNSVYFHQLKGDTQSCSVTPDPGSSYLYVAPHPTLHSYSASEVEFKAAYSAPSDSEDSDVEAEEPQDSAADPPGGQGSQTKPEEDIEAVKVELGKKKKKKNLLKTLTDTFGSPGKKTGTIKDTRVGNHGEKEEVGRTGGKSNPPDVAPGKLVDGGTVSQQTPKNTKGDKKKSPAPKTSADILANLRWYSVGEGLAASPYGLNVAASILNALSSQGSSQGQTDGRINQRGADNIVSYIASAASLTSSLATAASLTRPDPRARSLKVALYEDLAETRFTNPLGVDFGAPALAMPDRELIEYGPNMERNYRYIFIDAGYLEIAMREECGGIKVGPDGDLQEIWSLTAADTVIQVLDSESSDDNLAWSLGLVSLLPYPLIQVAETFTVTDPTPARGQMAHRRDTFFRNSSLVSIPNEASKIIFVISCQRDVSFNGTIMRPNCRTQRNQIMPVIAHPARGLILSALREVMKPGANIRPVWSSVMSCRSAEAIYDWGQIDQFLALLLPRFTPQPEVLWRDGTAYDVWAPNRSFRVKDRRYLALGTPSMWYHPEVVNAADMIPVQKSVADSLPVLLLGEWSSTDELITGLKIAYLVDTTSRGDNIAKAATSKTSPRSSINRATWMRRGVEEWKGYARIADDVISQEVAPASYSYIRTLVTSDPNMTNYQSVVGAALGDSKLEFLRLNWQVNFEFPIIGTLTGVRTSCAMWISDCDGGLGAGFTGTTYSLDNITESFGFSRWSILTPAPLDDYLAARRANRVNNYLVEYTITRRAPNAAYLNFSAHRYTSGAYWAMMAHEGWNSVLPSNAVQFVDARWTFAPRIALVDWGEKAIDLLSYKEEVDSMLTASSHLANITITKTTATCFTTGIASVTLGFMPYLGDLGNFGPSSSNKDTKTESAKTAEPPSKPAEDSQTSVFHLPASSKEPPPGVPSKESSESVDMQKTSAARLAADDSKPEHADHAAPVQNPV